MAGARASGSMSWKGTGSLAMPSYAAYRHSKLPAPPRWQLPQHPGGKGQTLEAVWPVPLVPGAAAASPQSPERLLREGTD
jgi:hypothetical protein